jgi:hypothetical protein
MSCKLRLQALPKRHHPKRHIVDKTFPVVGERRRPSILAEVGSCGCSCEAG